jgi:hypothetical protein
LGGSWNLDPQSQGKIVHGGNLHGNEKEGKKEETLTVLRNDISQGPRF